MRLQNKHIVVGITGGIAAYKSASLVRLLVKEGAEVQVVMTPAAKEFITPLTLATLSQHAVVSDFFDRRDGSWHSHVTLGTWADLMIIAPATASTIGKMAHGIADNILVTTYLAMRAPVLIAPAMDLDMWSHPTTARNLEILAQDGVAQALPAEGFLASGLTGRGRMQEPEEILEQAVAMLTAKAEKLPLAGECVTITAGPTYEPIDDVRFIGNHSSGLMGISLAEAFAQQGAEVHLVLGPTHLRPTNSHIVVHSVMTAEEMLAAAEETFGRSSVAVFAAAVADYRPEERVQGKIKKERRGGEQMQLTLTQNPDIAATLGAKRRAGQYLVGFALETSVDTSAAEGKLCSKHLDAIVLNSTSDAGAGFGVSTNKVLILDKAGARCDLPLESKAVVAGQIVDFVLKHRTQLV